MEAEDEKVNGKSAEQEPANGNSPHVPQGTGTPGTVGNGAATDAARGASPVCPSDGPNGRMWVRSSDRERLRVGPGIRLPPLH